MHTQMFIYAYNFNQRISFLNFLFWGNFWEKVQRESRGFSCTLSVNTVYVCSNTAKAGNDSWCSARHRPYPQFPVFP